MPTVPWFAWVCVGLSLTMIVLWQTDLLTSHDGGASAMNQRLSVALTLAVALPWAVTAGDKGLQHACIPLLVLTASSITAVLAMCVYW